MLPKIASNLEAASVWLRHTLRTRPLLILRQIIYWTLLALLFWKAAAMRFDLPDWPIAGRDSWGYSHAAFSKFAGGPFVHSHGRNFVYPGLQLLAMSIGKTVGAITVLQHLLGLATGALLLLCWERLRRFVRVLPQALHSLGGLALAAIYLLSSRPIQYEHDLRPEAITPFFAILNILLTLVFFEQRWGKAPSNRAAWTAGAILANSILLATLKTMFVLSVCASVVPVLVALCDRRETWKRRLAVLGAGVLAAAVIAIPEGLLAKSDPDAHAFFPLSLFSIHANLIATQMEADLARGQCGAKGCEWLRALDATLRADMAKGWERDKGYRTFGFDPDFLKYDPGSMESWPVRFFDGDQEKMFAFMMDYYWRTVRYQPSGMLRKIVTQTGVFYRARNPSFSKRTRVRMDQLYRETASNFRGAGEGGPEGPLVANYVQAARRLSDTQASVRPPLLVRIAIFVLAYSYRPVLSVVIALLFVAAFARRLRAALGLSAITTLFLFSYNFGAVLGTAIMHSLHILRYNETQYSLSLLAVCGGLLFVVETTLRGLDAFSRRWGG